MNIELKGCLEKFKQCSLCIIDLVEREEYGGLESKIDERQEIIDSISKLRFTKEEINIIVEELDILNLSEKVNNLISDKKELVKAEIEKAVLKKNASNNYNRNLLSNFHVFSKKV